MSGPRRPLLDPVWAVYAVGDHEIELRSPGRSVRLAGAAAAAILPAVLPMLDGQHHIEEIDPGCPGYPQEAVGALLSRMFSHGLLVDAESGTWERAQGDPSAIDEYLRATGAPRQAHEARAHLARSAIAVLGSGRLVQMFCQVLEEVPAKVTVLEGGWASEALPDVDRFAQAALVVVFGSSLHDGMFERANAASLASGTPWLPVTTDGVEAGIGPLVVPGQTACLTCLVTRMEAQAAGPSRLLRAGAAAMLPGSTQAVAGMVAAEAVRFLLKAEPPALAGRVVRINLRTMEWSRSDVLRLPRCRGCAGIGPARIHQET